MPSPQSRSVLITGTSSGIGRATALHLAAKGFRVFATVRRPEDAERLAAASASPLVPILLDVADEKSRTDAMAQVRAQLGDEGLGGLVNNAGIGSTGPLEFLPLEEIREVLEVNLVSAIAMTRLALPLLRASRGRLVNVSSIQARMTPPFFGAYATAKWGLRGVHETLRLELKPWGVESVLIEPGVFDTPLLRDKELPAWDQKFARFPAPAAKLYGKLSEAMLKTNTMLTGRAPPPDRVAVAIERALTARRPRTVVPVGIDANFMLVPLSKLPARLREWIAIKAFRLPGRDSVPS